MMAVVATRNLGKLDVLIESILRAARIPGGAIAVVTGGETVYAKGFGYRDLQRNKPLTAETIYPIASTTKTMNATLLGMLVDEGRLEWDAPVRRYLPCFRLRDLAMSSRVTVRDLVTMRTGLPRHDWVWSGSSKTRAQLVEQLAHLDLSADFRARFQYCNLTVMAAGHIAEVVARKSWETLVRERIFLPLGMRRTGFERPARGNFTLSYHENAQRKLQLTEPRPSEATAPAGGAVHSTVGDMAHWLLFNLRKGTVKRRRLIGRETLAVIHSPQVVIGDRPLAELPADGAYGMGWVIDRYNGHRRLWHGGYRNDVHSSIMIFPDVDIGVVSFTNFGCQRLAELINQHAFDALMGTTPTQTIEQRLAEYEAKVDDTRKRRAAVRRVEHTKPSRPLSAYSGTYTHAGYGEITIERRGRKLLLHLRDLVLGLKHWHYDAWIAEDQAMWPVHQPHAFDRLNPVEFQVDSRGVVGSVCVRLEPTVEPISFVRHQRCPCCS